jgi:hypothetical protein
LVGNPSHVFQEWVSHPALDSYWEAFRPATADFTRLNLPILTLTGSYDDDQPGALHYYREHVRNASASAAAKHYLVIGPWDHFGTLAPRPQFGGLTVGPAALVDILGLHVQWYDWIMRGGSRPSFLQKNVAIGPFAKIRDCVILAFGDELAFAIEPCRRILESKLKGVAAGEVFAVGAERERAVVRLLPAEVTGRVR